MICTYCEKDTLKCECERCNFCDEYIDDCQCEFCDECEGNVSYNMCTCD